MPPGADVLLLAGTSLVVIVVGAAFVGRRLAGRPSLSASDKGFGDEGLGLGDLDPSALIGGPADGSGNAPAYDRIVRIVSWAFLGSTAVIVASSGLWPTTTPAIFTLLALVALFVLLVHTVLPRRALGSARNVIEGSVTLVAATALLILTGGHSSPFFFTFPLIVGAAALVVSPTSTLIVSIGAAVGYIVGAYIGSGTPTPIQLATTAVNLTALLLLAYVGTVIGREQRRSRDAAIRLSALDSLTGLFNRTLFFAALERELARSARSGRGFCLLMLDLDELKAINDRHGHHTGDAALRAIADAIRSGVRRIDVAARYGGDEFVALLPETDPSGGWVLAEKIRIGASELTIAGMDGSPSVSIGVVACPRDGDTSDALMLKADQAMYAAKRAGRNRVAGPSTDEPADVAAAAGVPGQPV